MPVEFHNHLPHRGLQGYKRWLPVLVWDRHDKSVFISSERGSQLFPIYWLCQELMFRHKRKGWTTEQWGCKHPRQPWSSPPPPCWRTWGPSPRWEPSARPQGPARVWFITIVRSMSWSTASNNTRPYWWDELKRTLAAPGSLAWWGANNGYSI